MSNYTGSCLLWCHCFQNCSHFTKYFGSSPVFKFLDHLPFVSISQGSQMSRIWLGEVIFAGFNEPVHSMCHALFFVQTHLQKSCIRKADWLRNTQHYSVFSVTSEVLGSGASGVLTILFMPLRTELFIQVGFSVNFPADAVYTEKLDVIWVMTSIVLQMSVECVERKISVPCGVHTWLRLILNTFWRLLPLKCNPASIYFLHKSPVCLMTNRTLWKTIQWLYLYFIWCVG